MHGDLASRLKLLGCVQGFGLCECLPGVLCGIIAARPASEKVRHRRFSRGRPRDGDGRGRKVAQVIEPRVQAGAGAKARVGQ